jgi:hypothetical protein
MPLVTIPGGENMSREGFIFAGWTTSPALIMPFYKPYDDVPFSVTTTLYARWLPLNAFPIQELPDMLADFRNNAADNSAYIIYITKDEEININLTINQAIYEVPGTTNAILCIKNTAAVRKTITLGGGSAVYGPMFTIGKGVTLVLDGNITLVGKFGNNSPLIKVLLGGTVIINSGAEITGNINVASDGGGVLVEGGTLILNGGSITGNECRSDINNPYGGGAAIMADGKMIMNSGTISNNLAYTIAPAIYPCGGGVGMVNGRFTMNGGTIFGNVAHHGGGVYLYNHNFTMNGGTISSNIATVATGVFIQANPGSFILNGGIINDTIRYPP